MATSIEDSLFDFDVNYLRPTPDYNECLEKLDKYHKSISLLKKKTTATNLLIKKYHAKVEQLDQTERQLAACKEDSKKTCIEYNTALKTCTDLENELQSLKNRNKELEEKCINIENQYVGMKSHANQLQQLVKENETKIEALKLEQKLFKPTTKANDKVSTKQIKTLKKENETLRKHLALVKDVALGKRKLKSMDKLILQRYDDYTGSCSESGAYSDCDDSLFSSSSSPISPPESSNEEVSKAKILTKDLVHIKMNDSSNIIKISKRNENDGLSVDTGRGSSLACSDSEKFILSPSYLLNDSPLSDISPNSSQDRQYTDIATSPILMTKTVSATTSPISFDKNNVSKESENIQAAKITTDTNVVNTISNCLNSRGLFSPTKEQLTQMDTSVKINNQAPTILIAQEKECLELNNSNNICHENSDDGEIQSILQSMRLNFNLLTPIPVTPAKSVRECSRSKAVYQQTDETVHFVCPHAVALEKQFKEMSARVEALAKDFHIHKNMHQTPLHSKPENSKILLDSDVHSSPRIEILSADLDEPFRPNSVQTVIIEHEEHSSDRDLEPSTNVQVQESENNLLNDVSNNICVNNSHKEVSTDGVRIEFEESTMVPVESHSPNNTISDNNIQPENNLDCISMQNRHKKRIKLSKLGKLKKGLIPKSKITSVTSTEQNRKTIRPKPIIVTEKRKVLASDTSASLNDKLVYENAVKVLSETKIKSHKVITIKSNELSHSDDVLKLINDIDTISIPTVAKKIASPSKNKCEIDNNNCHEKPPQNKSELVSLAINNNTTVQHGDNTSIGLTNNKKHKYDTKIVSKSEIDNNYITSTHTKNCDNKSNMSTVSAGLDHNGEASTLNGKNSKKDKSKEHNIVQNSMDWNKDHSVTTDKNKKHNKDTISICTKNCKNKSLTKFAENGKGNNDDAHVTTKRRKDSLSLNERQKFDNHCDSESEISLLEIKNSIECKRRVTRSIITRYKSESENIQTELKTPIIQVERCDMLVNCEKRNLKRQSIDADPSVPNKRILRSTNLAKSEVNSVALKEICTSINKAEEQRNKDLQVYNDLDMFSTDVTEYSSLNIKKNHCENILCAMLEKYGVVKGPYRQKRVTDKTVKLINEKLETDIVKITELPSKETKGAMDNLVSELQNYSSKEFIYGLILFLQNPTRKTELYCKVISPPAPAMSKCEQVLLYIITNLRNHYDSIDFIDKMLSSIEYTLFAFNRTPEFNAIESMSHFYAVVCRYFKAKSRLRLFLLDAMYCLQFKSVVLIKQCIDVWMHILPLAHMGIAKCPLVTCLVYLLHFYKCEDKFNRVSELRLILSRRYFFNISDWNENVILEVFRTAIMDLRGNTLERKMLRLALIILGKRLGPRWCHKNIINNLLKPIMENNIVKENIKVFCITMLGPLLKPYPLDMKVHCEMITNELIDMLHKPSSLAIQEAIVSSLLYLTRQNQNNVIQALLYWNPKSVSPELEDMLKTYVRSKPVKVWKNVLTYIIK